MSQLISDLKAARAIITDPAHWTQGTFACNKYGDPVDYCSVDAVCFCVSGALRRAIPSAERQFSARMTIQNACGVFLLGTFNDSHTHAEVLALFDPAIAAAEAVAS